VTIVCNSLQETEAFARKLAGSLRPGDVLLLSGDLGAGKTTLTRYLVTALGGDGRQVSSPTFTLMARYPGPVPVLHVDLYRLGTGGDVFFDELGESLPPDGVTIIEWGERFKEEIRELASGRVRCVRIRYLDEQSREFAVS